MLIYALMYFKRFLILFVKLNYYNMFIVKRLVREYRSDGNNNISVGLQLRHYNSKISILNDTD